MNNAENQVHPDNQSEHEHDQPCKTDLTGASARKLMEAGDVEFAEKRLKKAIELYRRAFSTEAVYPEPSVYLELASRLINSLTMSGNPGEACELADQCLANLADSEIAENMFFRLYTVCGHAYSMHGEKEKAGRLFGNAKKYLRQAGFREQCLYYNAYTIYSYQYENNPGATLQNIVNTLSLVEKINDVTLKIAIYNSQGVVLLDTHNINKALECFQNAFRLILKQKKSIREFYIPMAYNNMALCYRMKGDLVKALKYLLDGIKASRHSETSRIHLPILYDNLGDVYMRKKDLTNAGRYLRMSLEICRKNHMVRDTAYAMVNLARLDLRRGKILPAMKKILEAIAFCDRFNSTRNIVLALKLAVSGYIRKNDLFNAVFYRKRLRDEEKKGNIEIDVREIAQIDAELKKLAKRPTDFRNVNSYELLLAAGKRFSACNDLAELLDFILEITTGFLSAEKGLIIVFRPNRTPVTAVKNIETANGIPVDPEVIRLIEISRESGEPAKNGNGTCIPLILKGRSSGIVYLETLKNRSYIPQEMMNLLIAVTDTASPAMENLLLLEEIKSMNAELKRDVNLHAERLKTIDALFMKNKPGLIRQYPFGDVITGYSQKMQDALTLIERASAGDTPIILSGETGTGKSLFAKLIHHLSPRKNNAFISQNCAAIPQGLIESELFGHVKGSFTGAVSNKTGLFAAADNGTLFLDEIGIMSMDTQAKILRALEDNEIRPVGSTTELKINVRLVCATNEPIQKLIDEKKFRQDLYYRLNVVEIRLPALRERREDVHFFINYIVNKTALENKTAPLRISKRAMTRLLDYPWPGNVRELENEIRRLNVICPGKEVSTEDLSEHIRYGKLSDSPESHAELMSMPYRKAQEKFERNFIIAKLRENDWNYTRTAKAMGIFRQQLARMLSSHKISKP